MACAVSAKASVAREVSWLRMVTPPRSAPPNARLLSRAWLELGLELGFGLGLGLGLGLDLG